MCTHQTIYTFSKFSALLCLQYSLIYVYIVHSEILVTFILNFRHKLTISDTVPELIHDEESRNTQRLKLLPPPVCNKRNGKRRYLAKFRQVSVFLPMLRKST